MSSYTDSTKEHALKLLARMGRKDVAAIVGCRIETVSRWARRAGRPIKQGRPYAATADQRVRIVDMRRRGLSYRAIGRIFDLHGVTIRRICEADA